MRFDDTLETVLASDLSTPYGVQSAWRQLVDLVGRRRVAAGTRAMSVLRTIRESVPAPVRAASARALEFADPPPPLVRLFALDDLPIALPVLRSARMNSAEWVQLLPDLSPAGRAVLRNRRDLSPVVRRALESFGPIDFVLPDGTAAAREVAETPPAELPIAPEVSVERIEAETIDWSAVAEAPAPVHAAPESGTVEEPEPIHDTLILPDETEAEAPSPSLVHWGVAPAMGSGRSAPAASEADEALRTPALAELLARLPDPVAASASENRASEDAVLEVGAREREPVAYGQGPQAEALFAFEAQAPSKSAAGLQAGAADADADFSFVALADPALSPMLFAAQAPIEAAPATSPDQSGTVEPAAAAEPIAPPRGAEQGPAMEQGPSLVVSEPREFAAPADAENDGTFEIAEVVARIDAFWRHREEGGIGAEPSAPLPAEDFRFETDSRGMIRWVEGVSRAPLIGVPLDIQGGPEGARVDGVAAGAFRRRAGFSNARLSIEGESDAAGDWLISAIPVFDPANGRFTGYRGTARRPRVDERAEPARPEGAAPVPADSLRQLVHELRTPTNAIAGFAEMIESQMLGPVPDPYRDRANVIRAQARELLGAIDDLDLAARIDSAALALTPGRIALRPVLAGIVDDLAPLAELRGSLIALPIDDLAVSGDRRAVERLLARLLATLVSASAQGERIGVRMALESDDKVAITIDRPQALADYPGDSVLGVDDEREDATLLGTGFALRLARNLARELGGALVIGPETLTLRLPAAVNAQVGQAHLN